MTIFPRFFLSTFHYLLNLIFYGNVSATVGTEIFLRTMVISAWLKILNSPSILQISGEGMEEVDACYRIHSRSYTSQNITQYCVSKYTT